MLEWLIDNAKKNRIGLAIVAAAVLIFAVLFFMAQVTVGIALACSVGGLVFGIVLGRLFNMRQKVVQHTSHEPINHYAENSNDSGFELISKQRIVNQHDQKDFSVVMYEGMSTLFGRFFHSSPKPAKKHDVDLVTEALSRCRSQAQEHRADIDVINKALSEFTQEGQFLTSEMVNKNQNIISGSMLVTGTEQEPVAVSLDRGECSHLIAQLRELMNTYPQPELDNNPTLESVELYYQDCEQHHDKVRAVAEVLLPNYRCLLNEVQDIKNTPHMQ